MTTKPENSRAVFEMLVMNAGKAIRQVGVVIEEHAVNFGSTDAEKAVAFLVIQLEAMKQDIGNALNAAEKIRGATFSLDAEYAPPTKDLVILGGHVDRHTSKIIPGPDLVLKVPTAAQPAPLTRTVVPAPEEIIDDEDDAALEALEARESAYIPEPVVLVAVGKRPTNDHKATGRLVREEGTGVPGPTVFELNGGVKPANPMPDMAGEIPDPVHKGIKLAGFIDSE
jgi:hypothetical protein